MRNIVLIGFMGTGKTSTGRLLAGRLNRPFLDIDKKIEQEQMMSVSEIFRLYGESQFRQMECNVIARVSRNTNTVIATGGGAVIRKENRERLMRNGIIISLTASVEAIVQRTAASAKRPLLDSEEDRVAAIDRLFNERAGLYKQADYIIDTTCYSPQYVAEKIIVFLRHGGYLRGRSFD